MKIEIRPWRLEDAERLSQILNNPSVQKTLRDGIPYPYTPQDGLFYIQSILESDRSKTFVRAITADNMVVGCVGAFRQENIHAHTAELGYYLDEAYWGKGCMTQAVQLLVQELFHNTDLVRIYATPFTDNFGSCSVLKKTGFQKEGILRCAAKKNGVFHDMTMYALIKENTI